MADLDGTEYFPLVQTDVTKRTNVELMQRQQDQLQASARKNGDYGLTVTAPFEATGGRPIDAKDPAKTVAEAVLAVARMDRSRSLMQAISKMHEQRASNGKPVVYVPE